MPALDVRTVSQWTVDFYFACPALYNNIDLMINARRKYQRTIHQVAKANKRLFVDGDGEILITYKERAVVLQALATANLRDRTFQRYPYLQALGIGSRPVDNPTTVVLLHTGTGLSRKKVEEDMKRLGPSMDAKLHSLLAQERIISVTFDNLAMQVLLKTGKDGVMSQTLRGTSSFYKKMNPPSDRIVAQSQQVTEVAELEDYTNPPHVSPFDFPPFEKVKSLTDKVNAIRRPQEYYPSDGSIDVTGRRVNGYMSLLQLSAVIVALKRCVSMPRREWAYLPEAFATDFQAPGGER